MSNPFLPQRVHPSENNIQQPQQPSTNPSLPKPSLTPAAILNNSLRTRDKDQVKFGSNIASGSDKTSPPGCCSVFWAKLVDKVWDHSLLKLCYKELILFIVLYNTLSVIYRHVLLLDPPKAKSFEKLIKFFSNYMSMISLPFLLGFYLTIIAQRWWQQYLTIPWPDRVMLTLSMYCYGTGPKADREKAKILRRVLMRRCLLMLVLLFRHISESVHDRFPNIEDLVQYGLMTPTEKVYFDNIVSDINLYWVPGAWFVSALQDGVRDGIITDNEGTKLIMEGFLDFRSKCGVLWGYNWITIPRVYGQVVTLATYSFFAACLVGRQCIENPDSEKTECHIDRYFPVWTLLEFVFYLGLLKVAEQMHDPFGDDEEDFDLNFLIDRHVKAIRLDIDYLGDNYPPLRDETMPMAKPMNRRNSGGPSAEAAGTSAGGTGITDSVSMSAGDIPRVKFSSSITGKF